MHFARRTAFDAEASGLHAAARQLRQAGTHLLDLTVTNPTRCGFHYEDRALLEAMCDPAVLRYEADAFGMERARRTVVERYYRQHGADLDPDQILLTASTSEAYGFLLKLLCDPGDQVMVPEPSYPLLDLLARLHDVELVPYPLLYHDRWQVEPDALERLVTPRCRAIVAVHPNNPTGHYAGREERRRLASFAARHGLALIADEVFLDYPVAPREMPVSFAAGDEPEALTFVMSGLSKVLALPQMKLAWTAVRGPRALREEALQRLEVIADTFLSAAAPAQVALEAWLTTAVAMQDQIRSRVVANLATLSRVLAGNSPLTALPVEGGWSVVLRVPALEPDTELALALAERAQVLVHPGSFYGFGERGWLVLSLLGTETEFAEGLTRIATCIDDLVSGEPKKVSSLENTSSSF